MMANNKYSEYFRMIDDIVREMFFNRKKHQNYDNLDEDSKQLIRNLFEVEKNKYNSTVRFEDILYK